MAELVAEVQERAMEWLDGPVVRIGSIDVPWPYNRDLEQTALVGVEEVLAGVRNGFDL